MAVKKTRTMDFSDVLNGLVKAAAHEVGTLGITVNAILPGLIETDMTRELPLDCQENAPTPADLFRKLDEWGFESLVIPHGLAWGIHAPPGARLDVQLSRRQHDPDRQRLVEKRGGKSGVYRAKGG